MERTNLTWDEWSLARRRKNFFISGKECCVEEEAQNDWDRRVSSIKSLDEVHSRHAINQSCLRPVMGLSDKVCPSFWHSQPNSAGFFSGYVILYDVHTCRATDCATTVHVQESELAITVGIEGSLRRYTLSTPTFWRVRGGNVSNVCCTLLFSSTTHIFVKPVLSPFLSHNWGPLSQNILHFTKVVASVLRELAIEVPHTFPVKASGKCNQPWHEVPSVCVLVVVFDGWS